MDASAHLENIQSKTPHEIPKMVSALAIAFRGLEAESRRQLQAAEERHRNTPDWFAMMRVEDDKTRAYVTDQFLMQLRPRGVALRDEMLRRLGQDPQPDIGDALQYGVLMGASALDETATRLERLARLLPN